MLKLQKHVSYSKNLILISAIIFALLFQSILQSYIIKCPAMAEAEMSSHADHMDMAEEANSSSDAKAMGNMDSGHSHFCPPSGCDICSANDCSQCAPFQLNAIDSKTEFWHKSQANKNHALTANFIGKNAFQTWLQPPTRAPPSIAI